VPAAWYPPPTCPDLQHDGVGPPSHLQTPSLLHPDSKGRSWQQRALRGAGIPTLVPAPALPCPSQPPTPEFEGAVLPVEGEEVDVDGTGAAEDGGRQPVDVACVVDKDVAVVGGLEEPIVAAPGESQGDGGAGEGPSEPWASTRHSSGGLGRETEAQLTCFPGLSQAATACPAAGGAPQCPRNRTCSTAGGNRSSPGGGIPGSPPHNSGPPRCLCLRAQLMP